MSPIIGSFSSGGSFSRRGKPKPAGLYDFTNATFTSANTVGAFPPSISTLKASGAYATTEWISNTDYFTYLNGFDGYQLWTVPFSGTYRITCAGAGATDGAANPSLDGGKGYSRRADFSLVEGERIIIVVGQPNFGTRSDNGYDNGAGGGSYVIRFSGTSTTTPTTSNCTPLLISGGGGGNSQLTGHTPSSDGNANQNAGSSATGQAGGTNGNGGPEGVSNQSCAGQGGGYFSDAGQTPCGDISTGVARGFFNGLTGGAGSCNSNNRSAGGAGGFGGGGGCGCGGSGGGGGYSGGSGSWSSGTNHWGSGGGSYVNTSLASSIVNNGAVVNTFGFVTVEAL